MLFGILKEVSRTQFSKVFELICCKPAGRFSADRFVQSEKAPSPIYQTVSGRMIPAIFEFPLNAFGAMPRTTISCSFEGILMAVAVPIYPVMVAVSPSMLYVNPSAVSPVVSAPAVPAISSPSASAHSKASPTLDLVLLLMPNILLIMLHSHHVDA